MLDPAVRIKQASRCWPVPRRLLTRRTRTCEAALAGEPLPRCPLRRADHDGADDLFPVPSAHRHGSPRGGRQVPRRQGTPRLHAGSARCDYQHKSGIQDPICRHVRHNSIFVRELLLDGERVKQGILVRCTLEQVLSGNANRLQHRGMEFSLRAWQPSRAQPGGQER